MCSCSSTKYYTHKGKVPTISTPTHREIKKAMKYSTPEYNNVQPKSYFNQVSVH